MADWHPLLAAIEDAPGFWRMVGQYDRCYGTIRLVKRANELGYRADAIAHPGDESQLVGYYRTLRDAASAVHVAHLQTLGTQGPQNGHGGR